VGLGAKKVFTEEHCENLRVLRRDFDWLNYSKSYDTPIGRVRFLSSGVSENPWRCTLLFMGKYLLSGIGKSRFQAYSSLRAKIIEKIDQDLQKACLHADNNRATDARFFASMSSKTKESLLKRTSSVCENILE